MISNKKGDEKIMSIWWFFVIVVIAGGVVVGVLSYYGADVDVREIESKVLIDKISECLAPRGMLNEQILSDNFDIFEECKLNKELFGEESNYYVKLRIEEMGGKIINNEMHFGQRAFEKNCLIGESFEQDQFAKCSFSREKVMINGRGAFLEIIAASDQKGRKNNILQ